MISKRLEKEIKRTMWQSGLLRSGNPNDRKYWMEERRQELCSSRLNNVFYRQ